MPNESQVVPDGAANGTPLPEASPPADAAPWRNEAEIKKALQGQRELQRQVEAMRSVLDRIPAAVLQQAATPPSAPHTGGQPTAIGQAEVNALIAQREAFADALADSGLDKAERGLVRRLFDAERPADPAEWLERTLASFPRRGTPAPQPATPAAPATMTPVVAQPAPARTPDGVVPSHPIDLAKSRPDVWAGMTREQRREAWAKAQPPSPVVAAFTRPPPRK